MYDIKDKVYLVTGAAAGIGAGVAKALIAKGAKHIAILDVDVKHGEAIEEELNSKYGENKAKFYNCDITTNELGDAFDDVVKRFGCIDVVINNAGLMNDGPEVYEKQVAVNVTALITSSLKAYNLMRKDNGGQGGTIINISSIAALCHIRLLPIYCATKSAVLQFSNCLGKSPLYNKTGVRVLTICFGCTKTSLFSAAKMGAINEEYQELLETDVKNGVLPFQELQSAIEGLIYTCENGASGSTWLIACDRPAKDITANISKAYTIMSQGIM